MIKNTILDINELKVEIVTILEKEKHIVLATCSDGRVTARTMSHVNVGVDIFIQTDKRYLKVEQINENPKVALCLDNIQIEGTAELLGHPMEPENAEFCNLYRQKHPHSFQLYTPLENEIIVKVRPTLFILWKYIDGKPCRDYLNMNENAAYREHYSNDMFDAF